MGDRAILISGTNSRPRVFWVDLVGAGGVYGVVKSIALVLSTIEYKTISESHTKRCMYA